MSLDALLAAKEAAEQTAEISKTTLALITGGAAILGSLVGGGVAGLFNLRGEDKRQEFERHQRERSEERENEAQATLVRASARLLQSHLAAEAIWLNQFLNLGFFWPGEGGRPAELERFTDVEARKAVAGAATFDEWTAVEAAELAISDLVEYRDIYTSLRRDEIRDGKELDFLDPAKKDQTPSALTFDSQSPADKVAITVRRVEAAVAGLRRLA